MFEPPQEVYKIEDVQIFGLAIVTYRFLQVHDNYMYYYNPINKDRAFGMRIPASEQTLHKHSVYLSLTEAAEVLKRKGEQIIKYAEYNGKLREKSSGSGKRTEQTR